MSCGASWAVHVAAGHPERVLGLVAIAPSCGSRRRRRPSGTTSPWDEPLDTHRGLGEVQQALLARRRLRRLRRSSSSGRCSPSRTRPSRSRTASAGRTRSRRRRWSTPPRAGSGCDGAVCEPIEPLCPAGPLPGPRGARHRRPDPAARRSASGWPSSPAATLVLLEGAGHGPLGARPGAGQPPDREFVDRLRPPVAADDVGAGVRRPPKRALYLSSPIGLGHARRDVAIAAELRARCTRTCRSTGSRSTRSPGCSSEPASGSTRRRRGWPTSRPTSSTSPASTTCTRSRRSAGWTRSWCTTSWCSTTWWPTEHYDLVIGDEAWDVDYFLHENPELKRFAFAWMTDFVGWLPMPDGGAARGGADRRLQRGDDRAARPVPRGCGTGRCSSATPTTSSTDDFGPGLPSIRTWTEENFDFAGYVTGFDPAALEGPSALRARARRRRRRAALPGHGRRVGRRDVAAAPGAGRRAAGPPAGAGAAVRRSSPARGSTRRRCRASDGVDGARLRAGPVPAPGRLRRRRGAGRADHDAWS